jgi:methyl-accepting chemotaxis protein
MQIKTGLRAGLVIMAGLAAAITVISNWQHARMIGNAGQAHSLVAVMSDLSHLTERLSQERGAAMVVMQGSASDAALATKQQSLDRTDAARAALAADMAHAAFPGRDQIAASLDDLLSGFDKLRGDEGQVSVTDPQALKGWIAGMLGLMDQSNAVADQLEYQLIELVPDAGRFTRIARTDWSLRDQVGRLSTLINAGLLANKPLGAAEAARIPVLDGRIEQLIAELSVGVRQPGMPEVMRDQFDTLQTGFVAPFAAIRAEVAPGLAGKVPYPFDVATWRARTQPLYNKILSLRDTAYGEALAATVAERGAAIGSLVPPAAIAAIAFAIMIWIGIVIDRKVSTPILRMTGAMERLAEGDVSIAIEGVERKDELGGMAKALAVFRDNRVTADRLATERAADEAAKLQRQEKLVALIESFDRGAAQIVDAVAGASERLRRNAESLSDAAGRNASQAGTMSRASDETSSNVGTVASAAEELRSSVEEISRQMAEAARVSTGAVAEAEIISQTVNGLSLQAERIGDVLQLIQAVAAKTNLLALNATIEAARAGEAGKGFAVVASEVKQLAHQTAEATGEIQNHIQAIRAETQRAVEGIGGIGSTIGALNQMTTIVAAAVEEQGSATSEIARSIHEAASGCQTVASNVTDFTETAKAAGHSADDVLHAAESLSQDSEALRKSVGAFLRDVAAA